MKLYYRGTKIGNISYSLDGGRTYIPSTLAEMAQGIKLPANQKYDNIKIQVKNDVLNSLAVLKKVEVSKEPNEEAEIDSANYPTIPLCMVYTDSSAQYGADSERNIIMIDTGWYESDQNAPVPALNCLEFDCYYNNNEAYAFAFHNKETGRFSFFVYQEDFNPQLYDIWLVRGRNLSYNPEIVRTLAKIGVIDQNVNFF